MKIKADDLKKLSKVLGYEFNKISLLEKALTHKSYSKKNNERLEFLGDSVLNFSISSNLFKQFPALSEGDLTRFRSMLVSKESLAEIAKELKLGDYVILGTAELGSGGHQRKSILADTLEAIFGAVFLDSNIDTAVDFIINLYKEKIAEKSNFNTIDKDSKTNLQEWLQAKGMEIPIYTVTKITGKPHEQTFFVECFVPEFNKKIESSAQSRKKAEQISAKKMLDFLMTIK